MQRNALCHIILPLTRALTCLLLTTLALVAQAAETYSALITDAETGEALRQSHHRHMAHPQGCSMVEKEHHTAHRGREEDYRSRRDEIKTKAKNHHKYNAQHEDRLHHIICQWR